MGRPALLCVVFLSIHLPSLLAQTPTVGRGCTESTECGQGAYCTSNKRCDCLSSYVNISGYCWRRINPGEAGCSQNRQCEAVWPNSYCSSGTCKCGNNQDPFPTPDGLICVNYGECPVGQHDTKYQEDGQIPTCTLSYYTVNGILGLPGTTTAPHTRSFDCPETYDCICGTADCLSNNNFCCPSKSYACTLQYDSGAFPGSGGGTVTRYYHDAITNDCKTFAFRGIRGNANNFETKEHCESYCTQTCERGRPQYTAGGDSGNQGSTGILNPIAETCDSSSTTSSSCRNTYTCSTYGTKNYCCPTVDSICSRTGSVAYSVLYNYELIEPTTAAPFDQGFAGSTTSETYARFYYDRSSARCRPFTWLGQAGNFNNFLTESHCEQYCSKTVCDAGIPLKDSTGVTNKNCGGNDANCPTSHQCNSNLCCPRPQFVCKLARATGSCGSYTDRWWFNAATGNCESFTYSGCQGNDNNFASYSDCQTFCQDTTVEPVCLQGKAETDSNGNFVVCGGNQGTIQTCPANFYCYYDGNTYGCCPNQAYTCTLSSDEGRECGPQVTRWYYDSTDRKCQTYTYFGCDGNSNNFATQQDCKEYCRVDSCPDGGSVYTDFTGQSATCAVDSDCPNTHYCTTISSYQSQIGFRISQNCCPSKTYVCSLFRDEGTRCSESTISRWWFNTNTRTCESFTYNGCAGNRNNFATKAQCQNYCFSAACPTGAVVSTDISTLQITSCQGVGATGAASAGCQKDYTCFNSQLLGQNVCCGAGRSGLCPASSLPFVSALTLQPQQCTPNVMGTCPGGYFCWYSANPSASNAYYCCQESNQAANDLCPPQLSPVPGVQIGTYKTCSPTIPPGTPNNRDACDLNHQCQFAERLNQYICCGSASTQKPNVCPPSKTPGVTLIPYYEGRDYRKCSERATINTAGSCPRDAACLYINPALGYICCRNPANTTAIFPRRRSQQKMREDQQECGTDAYTATGVLCSPSNPTEQCGDDAHCMFNVKSKSFKCCDKISQDQLDDEKTLSLADATVEIIEAGENMRSDRHKTWWSSIFG